MKNNLSFFFKEQELLDKKIGSHLRKGEFTPALKALCAFIDRFVQEPTKEQLAEQLSDVEHPTAQHVAKLHMRRILTIKALKSRYGLLLMPDKVQERYGALLNGDRPRWHELVKKYEGYENDPEKD